MIIKLLLNALAFYVTAYLVPGFTITGWQSLIIISIVWGILNIILKPILVLLTLPINLMTLGLFTFVINALILMLMGQIIPDFKLSGFGAALLGSVVLSLVSMFLSKLK
jgi:putative membrane protein